MLVADRFQVESFVGRGGMGEVYRATDLTSGEAVALKLMTMDSDAASERFARESRVLCTLRHPRIVRYVAHGIVQGQRYLAMEWIEGQDVAARLKRTGFTPGDAVALAARIADGLAAVHAHGIVHRDIKPSNLILPDSDLERVKIIDFGVARPLEDSGMLTSAGDTIGTPNYMSPEQARGETDLDERADLFALGCVLFECLTGRPPFAATSGVAVLAKILFEDPPRVSEIAPGLAALDDVLARLMAKDRRARPLRAAAVAEELRALPPLHGDAAAVAGGARDALTTSEKRLVCVVLALHGEPLDDGADTRTGEPVWDFDPTQTVPPGLLRLGDQHGARIETLRNRSVVAMLSSAGSATDLAARGAACALAMKRDLGDDVAIGLATGRAVMTSNRVPVGDVIDRAAALLPRGRGRVRIDDVTAGLLDPRFQIEGTPGKLKLAGEREPTEGTRRLLGKPTPCVGRERELSVLDGLWAECLEEPAARAAVLVGPPGIGKSRLRYEFLRRQREKSGEVEVWIARGDPIGAGSPFGLLSQALRRAFGIFDGEDVARRREKVAARVARSGVAAAERARIAEFLGELVGTPFPDGSVQLKLARRDLAVMGDRIRRAWEDFVRAEAARGPLTLLLEDLHWGDLPTVKLVDSALRACAELPFFVLAMARPEVEDLFPALWRERGAHVVRVNALSKKAAEKLVRAVLGAGDAIIARLVEQASGNAFYLEELIRGVADGREGLPSTVLAMLQARLEALPDGARRVLRAASVFGQTFWPGGVAALVGAATLKEVDDWLRVLADQEIVSLRGPGRFPGEAEVMFRHALVREAADAMLTDRDRRLGHRLAAAWLVERGETDALLLAEHHERGGEPERAVACLVRAAEQALEGNDLVAALARAERGVALGAAGEELGRLELVRAEAHRWRGEWGGTKDSALRAMRLLPRGAAPWSAAVSEAALACRVLDLVDPLLALVEEARGAPATGEPGPRLGAMLRVASLLYYSGRYGPADALLAEIAPFEEDVAADPAVMSMLRYCRGLRAAFGGEPETALRESEAAVALFEAAGSSRRACNMHMLVGAARLALGDGAGAERTVRAAIVAAEGMGLHNVAALGRQILGACALRAGRLGEALAFEREAAASFAEQADHRLEGTSRRILAQILCATGDLAAAEKEARAAVAILSPLPPSRVAALAALAEVHLLAGRAAEAVGAARDAMALLDELGSVAEGDAYARLVHARALAAAGDRAAADAALGAARARLEARAERISDGNLRASYLRDVPENAATRVRVTPGQ